MQTQSTRSLREPESTYPHFGSGDSEFSRHTFGIALSPRKAVATLRHDGVEVLDVISDRVQSILGDRDVFAADTETGRQRN
jgi:hypothetical protein